MKRFLLIFSCLIFIYFVPIYSQESSRKKDSICYLTFESRNSKYHSGINPSFIAYIIKNKELYIEAMEDTKPVLISISRFMDESMAVKEMSLKRFDKIFFNINNYPKGVYMILITISHDKSFYATFNIE